MGKKRKLVDVPLRLPKDVITHMEFSMRSMLFEDLSDCAAFFLRTGLYQQWLKSQAEMVRPQEQTVQL